MDIGKILEEIDILYSQQKVDEVEALVVQQIIEFKASNEVYPTLMLLNELLGIYREKGDKVKALDCCEDILSTFSNNNLPKDENYATTLLNIATAYRVFGKFDLSFEFYNTCIDIYNNTIDKNDYRFASLYNNLSLLHTSNNKPDLAILNLEKSLDILYTIADAQVPIATANTSLAQIYLGMGNSTLAKKHIDISLDIYDVIEDYHYSACLATAGDIAYFDKELDLSATFYKNAMSVIERYIGKTENYKVLEENLNNVQKALTNKALKLSKQFYLEFGKPMIETNFADFADKIAVGLVGFGSQCYGFDDNISKDHDYSFGFCMWLTDDVFDEIGEQLQQKYDKLPTEYKGITKTICTTTDKREGVFKIGDFYKSIIGYETVPMTENIWHSIDECSFSQATNGEVFIDTLGEFSKIRNILLNHYPNNVLAKKIADTAHIVSQTGQYNFKRTLKRKDYITARIILNEFMVSTIDLVFLLNKTYAPFYKWKVRMLKELPLLFDITRSFEKIEKLPIDDNEIINIIERVVSKLINELKNQKFIKSQNDENFLDFYVQEILTEQLKNNSILEEKKKLVEQIVKLEWEAFDKVQGIDGRATCQDDYKTFNIMRSSQFLAWTTELLLSYISDFEKALSENRNPISEKYGVMMKTTDYENYKLIENQLPKLSQEQSALIEVIVAKQLDLMISLQPKYPKLVQNSRTLRTEQDSMYDTSYETYLRGELSTHSIKTNQLYNELLDNDFENGVNTVMLYILNTAKLYGYDSLDEAESSL